jgi:hypothetical protein
VGLHLSVASGLDGVTDVAVVADPMAHGGTPRRKVVPSLLSRLGALGPWPIKTVARDVDAASSHLWGVSVGAVPVGSGRHLGWLGEHGAVLGG